jgi:hypothetical protein
MTFNFRSKLVMFLFAGGLGATAFVMVNSDGDPNKSIINNKMTASQIMTALKSKVVSTTQDSIDRKIVGNENLQNIQCLSDEIQYLDIEKDVLLPFKNSLRGQDLKGLEKILVSDFFSHDFSKQDEKGRRELEGITNITYANSNQLLDKKMFLNTMKTFLGHYQNIEFAEISGDQYFSPPELRLKDKKMNNVTITAHYDLRGLSKTNHKLQDRGQLAIKVRQNKDNVWQAYKIEILNRERLFTNKVFFNDISKASKIVDHVPSYLRREAIRRGGYAMAIGDYNNDSKVDLYVATVAESVLLKGETAQSFSVDAQAALENKSLVKAAAFADFDNNGTDELLLVRFAPNEAQTKNDRSDIQILNNTNGHFSLKQGVVNFEQKTAYAMPLALADFDGDSHLDFYVGFPGAKDFTTLGPAVQKRGLATQGVFYNEGKGSFKAAS